MKTHKKRREKINTTITESTIEKINIFCDDNNIDKSKLIEKLIKQHLEKEKSKNNK